MLDIIFAATATVAAMGAVVQSRDETPREIYAAFRIMPGLQLHMLRVAAVGKMICDNFTTLIDSRMVVLDCLFHDMGNIIKSDLSVFPDFLEPQGREYWEEVKKEFLQKYGREEHSANADVARDIGLPQKVIDLMNKTGFSKVSDIAIDPSFELKICQYADMRVGPRGILSMEERLQEGRRRYLGRESNGDYVETGLIRPTDEFERLFQSAVEIEKQIFALTTIAPESINDISAGPVIKELWEYPIS